MSSDEKDPALSDAESEGWPDPKETTGEQEAVKDEPVADSPAEVTPEAPSVPAGWFPDPEGSGQERYWNGSSWTGAYRPYQEEQPTTVVIQQPTYVTPQGNEISPTSRTVMLVIAFFFGYLGIHRFWVGKIGTGLLMLFTAGGFGIWWLIDVIVILAGGFQDKRGRPVSKW